LKNHTFIPVFGLGGGGGEHVRPPFTGGSPHGLPVRTLIKSFYDWRDRPIVSVSGNADVLATTPSTYLKYDNLGQVIERDAVVGTDPFNSAPSSYANGPDAASLRGKTTYAYDDLGRVTAVTDFAISPDSTSTLVTTTVYDDAQRKTKTTTPDGVVTTTHHDGAGRVDDVTVGDGATVFESSHTTYDADGNPTLIVSTQRQADYSLRTSYAANWYDLAGRLTDTADLGTHGGVAYTRPASPPERSDDALLTSYEYDAQGRLEFVTDPNSIITRTEYDPLGRVAATTEAYATISIDAVSNPSQNRVTKYAYNGNNQVVTQTAVNVGKPDQVTRYDYGSTGLLDKTRFPDKESGQPSAATTDQQSFTYNALGEVKTKTDQNGTTHTYTIDNAGRTTADTVTLFGEGIDQSVMSHTTAFDSSGRAYLFSSLDESGQVVNQVKEEFNGYNQLTAEFQAVTGAVDVASTPAVRYGYDAAHASRLSSMTYPDGRKINYVYDGNGATINRVSGIVDDATLVHLEDYTYLGLDTIVGRAHPEVHSALTTGLDDFGRDVDQKWTNTASGLNTDRFVYRYNRDGAVLSKFNEALPTLSELYEVDLLNRLKSYSRGPLNDDFTAIANPSTVKTWDLDSLGNHDNATTTAHGDTTAQSQTTNAQNQVTAVNGTALQFDNNGNTLTDERSHTFVYDAWNHLVKQTSPSTETFTYDALGRKVTRDTGDGAQRIYYSAQWQVLEQTTANGEVETENVWSLAYVNGLVEQSRDTDHDGSITSTDQRLYAQQDANWNTTSLLDALTGQVVERYIYDPYGSVTIITPEGAIRTASVYAWTILFQGGDLDPNTNHYTFDKRDYDPELERWLQEDDNTTDGSNRYAFGGNPINHTDPSGAAVVEFGDALNQRISSSPNESSMRPCSQPAFENAGTSWWWWTAAGAFFGDIPRSAWGFAKGGGRFIKETAFRVVDVGNDTVALTLGEDWAYHGHLSRLGVAVNEQGNRSDFSILTGRNLAAVGTLGASEIFLNSRDYLNGNLSEDDFQEAMAGITITNLIVAKGAANAQARAAAASETRSPLLQRYLSESGGRWGSNATRALNNKLAAELIDRGYTITGGVGRAAEEYIPGAGPGTKGGTFVDLTAMKGSKTIRIQTINTLADGVTPTPSETAAAARIRAAFPNDELRLIPK
jgi:RHS repeat-associated protein